MSNITIRDIPERLHQAIKQDAKKNRRSMNQQIIIIFETYFTLFKNSYGKTDTAPNSNIQDTQS